MPGEELKLLKSEPALPARDPLERDECEKRLQFETLLSDLSARFVNVAADQVDSEIEDAQQRVCECLDVDLSAMWRWDPAEPDDLVLIHLYRRVDGPTPPERMVASEHFPWCLEHVRANRPLILDSTEEAPPEAAHDLVGWRHYGIKTVLNLPLSVGGAEPFGCISFNDTQRERKWTAEIVTRLELVAQVFANAMLRCRSEKALRISEARLTMAATSAGAGMWSLNLASNEFWVTEKTRELFAFTSDESITWERFLDLVHPEDRESVSRTLDQIVQSREEVHLEYRILRPDGTLRWVASRGRLQCNVPGETSCVVMGVSVDITAQKQMEQELRDALQEVEALREKLEHENTYLRDQVRNEANHTSIVGESEVVRHMISLARRVAPTHSAVLISGETGTGKEILAQTIHDLSDRKDKVMVKVNCAALPAPLVESELFGREKGAYTGAMTSQVGRFELADQSTIFLDEIGDLPLELQPKLLRVLQDGQFERLGGHAPRTTRARIIAATNRDLGGMVKEGSFREDLFHRLHVFPIEVPPLRDRAEDIPQLVWKFVQDLNARMGRAIDSIPKDVMQRLMDYDWPGNIRELHNFIERAMIISDGSSLVVEPPRISDGHATGAASLEDVERTHILAVLEQAHWRVSGAGGAAEILGLVPTTLHSRMKKLGIKRPAGG